MPSQRERFDRARAVLGGFEAGEVVLDGAAVKNRPADVEVVFIAGFYATDLNCHAVVGHLAFDPETVVIDLLRLNRAVEVALASKNPGVFDPPFTGAV